jgi:uncharacterized protein YdeI (YjbR/CyaY-like superfamily)
MSEEKIEAFYAKEQPFKEGIATLRELALKTEFKETLKWGAPVYTINNKNVLGIMCFKHHFGIWFFNGVFLSDPKKVLQNAQDGKTKAMRHWRFNDINDIDKNAVLAYMQEAIENQKKGVEHKPERTKKSIVIPEILAESLNNNRTLKNKFDALSPYKQREFCEHIISAKQEKTKLSRLEKIIPMVEAGIGLNDKYKNC